MSYKNYVIIYLSRKVWRFENKNDVMSARIRLCRKVTYFEINKYNNKIFFNYN